MNADRSSAPSGSSTPSTIHITGSRGEQVTLPPQPSTDHEVSQPSASINDIQDCTVDIRSRSSVGNPLANLQIFNAQKSLIICGQVNGAVFLSDSQDCVLVVTSGQLRLFKCQNCIMYLHCTSKPVIELSDGIKFAPLPSMFVSSSSPQ